MFSMGCELTPYPIYKLQTHPLSAFRDNTLKSCAAPGNTGLQEMSKKTLPLVKLVQASPNKILTSYHREN
jgi:hypothetical protein